MLAVGAGGAIGSMLRFGLTPLAQRLTASTFPLGTMVVNVLGSFAAGLLFVWLIERGAARMELRPFLMIGLLGGFTTFSAFSLDTVRLMMQQHYGQAVLNVVASVGLCLLGTVLGVMAGRYA